MKIIQTAERNTERLASDNIIYHRHLIAYKEAAKLINGTVLEIGCGEGYGIKILAPHAKKYFAIDKFNTDIDHEIKEKYNIDFRQMVVPPLNGFADNTFDFVVSFQVIEHIIKDDFLIKEIVRVLKPGGKLILTTPNIKTSLTRNPWHIREYRLEQFENLLSGNFKDVMVKGIFGNEKVMNYYEKNKDSVKKFTQFDIFNLQYILPRWCLKIPYDIMNRMNRNKLMKQNKGLINDVITEDFYLSEADEKCFDFFCIACK